MCTGFFYNDWFAKPIVLQKSYWINTFSVEELSRSENVDLDPAGETRSPYPWGKDPVWAVRYFYINTISKATLRNALNGH